MKRTLKPIFPPAGIEKEYEKRLKRAVCEMEHSVVYWLSARYKANESKILDSATDDILKAFRRLLRQWTRNFNELCETLPRWFVSKVRGYTARNLIEQTRPLRDAGLGFNLKFSYMSNAERQVFQAIVSENVNLIKSIASESLTQVEGIVLRGITSGNDLSTVTEQLHHQFGVTERRAAMIARDQTNKATNNLSRQRLLDYGVTKGIWMHTASGKTYRETHENEMDGQEYDIREGCFDPDEKVNRYIQPAELVNCYCVCRPVIPQLSEEETEQGIEEILQEVGDPLPETPKEGISEEVTNINNRDYSSDVALKLGKEQYDNVRDIVDRSTDADAVSVWNLYESKVNVLDVKYKGRAHYSNIGRGIKFNLIEDAKGSSIDAPHQVFFHESAHNIDALAKPQNKPFMTFSSEYGKVSEWAKNGSFVNAIHADVDALVDARAIVFKKEFEAAKAAQNLEWFAQRNITYYDKIKYAKAYVYDDITREIKNIPAIARGNVSDIFEGATHGRISAGIGHGKAYWTKRTYQGNETGLATEAFAEMFDSVMTNPDSLEQIKKYLPSAYKVFRKMLKELAKRGVGL